MVNDSILCRDNCRRNDLGCWNRLEKLVLYFLYSSRRKHSLLKFKIKQSSRRKSMCKHKQIYFSCNIIQLVHSFGVNIRICKPENSDVHLGVAETPVVSSIRIDSKLQLNRSVFKKLIQFMDDNENVNTSGLLRLLQSK